jgi:hypothetical protein
MRIDQLAVFRHHLANILGDGAHLHRIWTDDPELHREADRRTKHETVDARTRLRQRAVGDRLFQPRLEALAPFEVFGDDHDLGEVGVRQFRIEPQPEPRGAGAHKGRVAVDKQVVSD